MNEGWLWVGFSFFLLVALLMALYPLKGARTLSLAVTVLLLSATGFGYWHWGSWPAWHAQQQAMVKQQQVEALMRTVNGPNDIIRKLKERLQKEPKRAKGWYLLGRLYTSQGDFLNAKASYATAHQLEPHNEQYTIHYAQSMWQLNHQAFNGEIRAVFRDVLKDNPNQPDALAMLAMDAYLRHAYRPAIGYWQHLLTLVPNESEDARAIRKAIARAQKEMR